MEQYQSTAPFGRRSLTLAHVATQALSRDRAPEAAVHKWNIFRAICTARARISVSERSLAVLDALLSFHPETVLTGDQIIVFPSNRQLALRAHGMAPATLRRHLAALVDAGLVIRRDSPNGKRYARKGQGGEIETAFGFDLGPIVARAGEIEAWAEAVHVEERALRHVKERITICRRDIGKMIATGIEEGVPFGLAEREADGWSGVHMLFRSILGRIERTASRASLEAIAEELSLLASEMLSLLENHAISKENSANESHAERHKQNSKPKNPIELEPSFPESTGQNGELQSSTRSRSIEAYPLRMVLHACPDIIDYAQSGISDWRDFEATTSVIRSMLGISPSAWEAAQAAMGTRHAAIVIAAILQRGATVSSPGGYLRDLTRRAERAEFSVGPMLMASLSGQTRKRIA
jgi:replication initiation protein RepC